MSSSPNTSLFDSIIPKLKHSLSLTLHHFLVGEHGVVSAVVSFSKSIRNLNHMNGFLGTKESSVRFINSTTAKNCNEIGVITVAGSPRFEVYSTDFGWGKPNKVEMTSLHNARTVCISESKNGNGGVEIGLVLNMEKMEAFAKGLEAL